MLRLGKSTLGKCISVIQRHCVVAGHAYIRLLLCFPQQLIVVWVLHEFLLVVNEQLMAASVGHHFIIVLILQVSGGKHQCIVKWETSSSSPGWFNWTVLLVPGARGGWRN